MTPSVYEPERFSSPEYLAVLDDTQSPAKLCLPASCFKAIQSQSETGYPHEICGLLIGSITESGWMITEVRPVNNLNTARASDRFELDPAAYQRIDRELRGSGHEIIGVYHSHPDAPAKPSPTDLCSAWEGFAYPIISICEGKVADLRCWSINQSGDRFQQNAIVDVA